jgi:PLD-like domain
MKLNREVLLGLMNRQPSYVNVSREQVGRHYDSVRKLVLMGAVVGGLLVYGRVAVKKMPVQNVRQLASATEEIGRTAAPALAGVSAGGASVLVVDSPRENLQVAELGMLAKAKRSVDVAMDEFDDVDLARELVKLKTGGVAVRVYLGQSDRGSASQGRVAALAALLGGGVEVRAKVKKPSAGLASYVIDNSLLRTGATQWKSEALVNPASDGELVFVESPVAVQRFEEKFAALWEREDNVVLH